jgi:hypothetical protein
MREKKAAGPQGYRRFGIDRFVARLANRVQLLALSRPRLYFFLPALIAAWAAARRAIGTRKGEQLT